MGPADVMKMWLCGCGYSRSDEDVALGITLCSLCVTMSLERIVRVTFYNRVGGFSDSTTTGNIAQVFLLVIEFLQVIDRVKEITRENSLAAPDSPFVRGKEFSDSI